MFDNIIIGQYVPGNSFIHRLDARAKLLCLLLFMIFLFLSRNPLVLLGAITLTGTSFFLSKISIGYYIKGMRFIAIIIFITFIMHILLTTEGTPLFSTSLITIYREGAIQGTIMALRLLMLVVMASLLTLTTTTIDLTDAMERLLNPLKKVNFPVHELALMMSIALRFIPTLLDEAKKIIKAQLARGANFSEGSLWKRLKAIVPIFVPLIVQAFKRAEELAMAMEARGYEGGEGRTKFRDLQWQARDTIIVSMFSLFAILILVIRIGGGY